MGPLDDKIPCPRRGPRSFDRYDGFPKLKDLYWPISFTISISVMQSSCRFPVEYKNTDPATENKLGKGSRRVIYKVKGMILFVAPWKVYFSINKLEKDHREQIWSANKNI